MRINHLQLLGRFDIIEGLWNHNLHHILRTIFDYLDAVTLSRCRSHVSRKWKWILNEIPNDRIHFQFSSNRGGCLSKENPTVEFEVETPDAVKFLELSEEDEFLVAITANGWLVVYDGVRRAIRYAIQIAVMYPITAMTAMTDWIVTGSINGIVRIWTKLDGKLRSSLRYLRHEIKAIAFVTNSTLLVLSAAGEVTVTDNVKSRWIPRNALHNPDGVFSSMAVYSNDKTYFAIGGSKIRVWRLSARPGGSIQHEETLSLPSHFYAFTLFIGHHSGQHILAVDRSIAMVIIFSISEKSVLWQGHLSSDPMSLTFIVDMEMVRLPEYSPHYYLISLHSNSELAFWKLDDKKAIEAEKLGSWKTNDLMNDEEKICTPTCLAKRNCTWRDDYFGFLVGSSETPAIFLVDFWRQSKSLPKRPRNYFRCPQCGLGLRPAVKSFHFIMTCPGNRESRQILQTNVIKVPSIGTIFLKMTLRQQFGLLVYGEASCDENDLRTIQSLVELYVRSSIIA